MLMVFRILDKKGENIAPVEVLSTLFIIAPNTAPSPSCRTPAPPAADRNSKAFLVALHANASSRRKPRLLAKASGMHYWTPEGRQILDGVAGLWCVNAGHGRREITQAVCEPARDMDYAPPFQMGSPGGVRAGERAGENRARAARSRVFSPLRIGIRRHGAENRPRLAPGAPRWRPHAGRLIGRAARYHGVGFAASRWAHRAEPQDLVGALLRGGPTTCAPTHDPRGTLSRAAHRRTERSW